MESTNQIVMSDLIDSKVRDFRQAGKERANKKAPLARRFFIQLTGHTLLF
jgi:hypothetical protein